MTVKHRDKEIMKTRFTKFLEKNDLISPNQYGFCHSLNISNAIFRFVLQLTTDINNTEKPLAVFLDLRKTFDTVSHQLKIKLYL